MDKVAEILESAKKLTPEERKRLLRGLGAVDADTRPDEADSGEPPAVSAAEALLRLAGITSSEHPDLSTDKYKHVAAAADPER